MLETRWAHKAGSKGANWRVHAYVTVDDDAEYYDVEFGDGTKARDEGIGRDAPNAGLARAAAEKQAKKWHEAGLIIDSLVVTVFRWEENVFDDPWTNSLVRDAERVDETEQYGHLNEKTMTVEWGEPERCKEH